MKIFIVSNTLFGYKGTSNNQFSYFYDKIIPFLEKNSKPDDIFIHGGNIFNNKKNVSMDIINNVMDIFEKISSIIPIFILKSENDELASLLLKRITNINIVDNYLNIDNITLISYKKNMDNVENDIIIFNNNYFQNPELYKNILKKNTINICTHNDDYPLIDDNIINIGSPYQLNDKQTNKKGFLIIDSEKKKYKFIDNKYSPIFTKIYINTEEDFDKIKINKNDIINLHVKEDLLNKKELFNKFNIIINKHNFRNITYIKNDNEENLLNNDNDFNNNFNIRDIIKDYISNNDLDLLEELDNVYNIFNKKYYN